MQHALDTLKNAILTRLPDGDVSIDLYGSVPLGDFRPGWSDIDLLILTGRDLTCPEAAALVPLRQTLLQCEPENPYYRAMEGAILPLSALLGGRDTQVVYWGTSGQRIKARHDLSAIEYWQLRHQSAHLHGPDRRMLLPAPTSADLTQCVRSHLQTIRAHGRGESTLYAFGWLLDIARGLYTVETGAIISKTAAGQWALERRLCPDEAALALALRVRESPALFQQPDIRRAALGLTDAIQRFADVLENAM